jgi:membrane protease YdiL (CAAX protease family)
MSQGTVIAVPRPEPRASAATWIGLFLSLFSMIIVRQIFLAFAPNPSTGVTVLKETINFALAGVLLWLVKRGERLPLRSIGLGTSPWWKSLLWGLVTGAVCFAVVVALALMTHYGQGTSYLDKLPVSVVTVIVLRAGIVEELFYRGYAIDRLEAIGLSRPAAVALPLIIFSVGHWTGGWANILIALAAGAILTAFYLWRKDLAANMIGHFLVDFVANVLPRLAG